MKPFALALFFALGVNAQWLHQPDTRLPRTKDGKPNLAAPTPRLSGRPDLSGLWEAVRTPREEFLAALGPEFVNVQVDINDLTKYGINVFWGTPPGQEPMSAEAAAIMEKNQGAPPVLCLPGSVPMASQLLTFKMVQTPQQIVVLHEGGDPARQIYIDGRALPVDPQPSWMGYSTGKWQGDTLVVETIGITDRAPIDIMGHPRSESMRITERYRRRDVGHMDLEVTFDDPKYYTKTFGFKTELRLIPDSDVLEYICTENEKSLAHLK
jgi:hypothetical protein